MSTLAEVRAAYDANADYEEAGSTVKVAAFITACIRLIGLLPKSARQGSATGGEQVDSELAVFQDALKHARAWRDANTTGGLGKGSVTFLSFRDDFR